MSEEQIWYLYQNGKQVGPFDSQQVIQLASNNMIAQDGYIFKVGWKDWRPIEEGFEELGIGVAPKNQASVSNLENRRKSAPRATISGRIVVHNNGQLIIGQGVNISATGIFVETKEQIFSIGEELKLSVRCGGVAKAFNVIAKVIRFNSDERYPIGYGLRFENLDDSIVSEIQRLVESSDGERATS